MVDNNIVALGKNDCQALWNLYKVLLAASAWKAAQAVFDKAIDRRCKWAIDLEMATVDLNPAISGPPDFHMPDVPEEAPPTNPFGPDPPPPYNGVEYVKDPIPGRKR